MGGPKYKISKKRGVQVVKLYLAPKEYAAAKFCAGAYKDFIGNTGKVYVSYFMQDAIRKYCLHTLKRFGGKQGIQQLRSQLVKEVSDEAKRMRAVVSKMKMQNAKDYLNTYRKSPWLVGKTADEKLEDNWVKTSTRIGADGKRRRGRWLFKPWENAKTELERKGWEKIRDFRKLRREKTQDGNSN